MQFFTLMFGIPWHFHGISMAVRPRDQNTVFGPNTQDVWPPDYSVWPLESGPRGSSTPEIVVTAVDL